MKVTLLSRLRRARWVHVLQLFVFTCWVANPFPGALSYWTDSNSDGVKEEVANPVEGDSWWDQDADGDGLLNAAEVLFGSDPYSLDSDRDGLADPVEYQYSADALSNNQPLPYDPWNWDTNGNGFSDFDEFYQQIQGYTPVVNYNSLTPVAGSFFSYSDADGDGLTNPEDGDPLNMDRDNDGFLNWNDAGYMDDPNNGSTPPPPEGDPGVWIGGNWYPTGTSDSDADGTPDQYDSFPYGSYWYNGMEYGGTWNDRDYDGIPDDADAFPDGSYWYNGVEYGGAWVDPDGDGVPDWADPWPSVAGSYWYNGSEYPGAWNDQDGDSIPDAADPTPNGSYWWNGTEYYGAWVDSDNDGTPDPFDLTPNGGSSYWWNGTEYLGEWMDSDNDGIPDAHDATPSGGYWYNGTEYAGTWSDMDSDGIPDDLDATPSGGYWYNGTEYAGMWSDMDNDGVPDAADLWPWDWWNGASHFTYNGIEYAGDWSDRDNDTVPDAADAYPDDPENNADNDGDGLSNYAENTQHGTDPGNVDSDGDGLTDFEELYTYHTNPLAEKTNPNQLYTDFYIVDQIDSDSDGIPNRIEQWYAGQGYGMSANDANDALGDLDGDGYSNREAYFNGWNFTAHLTQYDNDADRVLDVLEDAWSASYPGILSSANFDDAVQDFDNDGLMNFEEIANGLNPGSANSRSTGVSDLQEWVWRANMTADPAWEVQEDGDHDGVPEGLMAFVTALNANPALVPLPQRVTGGDYDGDGMPDVWEHRHHLLLRDAADVLSDPDGDGLTNLNEHRFQSNPRVRDSNHDNVDDASRLYASNVNQRTLNGLTSRYQSQMAADFAAARGAGLVLFDHVVPPPDNPPPTPPDVIMEVKKTIYTNNTDGSETTSAPEHWGPGDSITVTSQERPTPTTNPNECHCGCRGTYSNPRPCPGTSAECSCGYEEEYEDTQSPPYDELVTPESPIYGPPHCHCEGEPHSTQNECGNWSADVTGWNEAVYEQRYHTRNRWVSTCQCEAPTADTPNEQWETEKAFFRVTHGEPDELNDHLYRVAITVEGVKSHVLLSIPKGQTQSNPTEVSQAAADGEEVTIAYDPPAEEPGRPGLPPCSISTTDSAGSRYRKIGLNGLPLSDAKPQVQDEGGERDEETYIDAFTRQLHHAVTDVYASDPTTLLPLSVRRDAGSEAWNMRSGQRLDERPDLPFGPCWTSNLCSYVRFEFNTVDPLQNALAAGEQGEGAPVTLVTAQESATVVDEQGAGQRFLRSGVDQWQHSREEMSDARTQGNVFTGLTLTKKFGTTCQYEMTGLTQTLSQDRLEGSDQTTKYTYARLTSVTDRLGNRLLYEYADANSLIPSKIYDPERPGRQLFIMHSGGRVSAVRGPAGEEIHYTLTGGTLTGVQRGNATVHYGYMTAVEDDVNAQIYGGPVTPITHVELASITDELGRAYAFTRLFNQDLRYESRNSSYGNIELRVQLGQPMTVSTVVMPDEQTVTISGQRRTTAHLSDFNHVEALGAVTSVSGPAGTFGYQFGGAHAYTPSVLNQGPDDDLGSTNLTVTYTQMSLTSAAGVESYTFDPDAMFALASATDLSGNTTSFQYAGGWDDPVRETDALGNFKDFTYDAGTRVMTSMKDQTGVTTEYTIQAGTGLKLAETVRGAGGAIERSSQFQYQHPTFAGFMTRSTVDASSSDTAPPTVTNYELGNGDTGWTEVTQTTQTASGVMSSTTVNDCAGNKRSVIDGRGLITNFEYDASLRLVKVTHPDNAAKHLAYDAHGNLTRETNENGVSTLHEYDVMNRRVKSTVDLNGNGTADASYTTATVNGTSVSYDGDISTTTTYNERGQVATVTDARGKVTAHTYDAAGRLITTLDGNLLTSFDYSGPNSGGSVFDSSGFKPTQITAPRGVVTTLTYDKMYRTTAKTVSADGITATTSTLFDAAGRPTRVTDALGRHTLTVYDVFGQVQRVTNPDGTQVSTDYTHHGKPWKVVDEAGNLTTTEFDAAGRAVKTIAPAVNGVSATTRMEYDAAGNAIRVTDALGRVTESQYDERNRVVAAYAPPVWDALAGTFVRPGTQTSYDALGQVTSVTDPQGNVTTKHYDRAGRNWLVEAPTLQDSTTPSPIRPTTLTKFDAGGLALTLTNPLSQTVTNTYDTLGRLITTTDAVGIVNTFAYDEAGNRTSVKDGKNQTTTFVYDGFNRLTSQTFANGDTWTHTYDAVRKLSQASPRGITTTYTYDNRDRVTATSAPDLQRNHVYDVAGRLLSVSEPSNTAANVSYTYDVLGHVLSETSRGITHSYTYDIAGNRTRADYGTGRSVLTSYDALNRPESIVEGGRATRYGYDLGGRAVILMAGNGQVTSNSYDALGRLKQRSLFRTQTMGEGDVLARFEWQHDLLGNVTSQSETWPGEATRPGVRTTSMAYDANNRLTNETIDDPTAGVTTTAYAYDNANNRSTKQVTGGTEPGQWTYAYNAANQLTSWQKLVDNSPAKTAALTYDAAGNRIAQTVQEYNPDSTPSALSSTLYAWDAQDRLASVTMPDGAVHAYKYDYRTRRLSTTRSEGVSPPSSTAILFAGGLSLAEWDNASSTPSTANAPTAEYTRGPDMGGGVGGMLYSLRGGTTKYSLSNGRGDIVAQADQSAALTWTASYEAYGKRTKETGTNNDKQRANSKDEDPTGLLNEGFRYRDIETGVWLSRDPAGFVDGPNLYAYVMQNPWTAFDPDGLKAVVYFRKQDDFDHATKVQKSSKDGGFYKDARLILLQKNDKRNAVFFKSGVTGIGSVTEDGVRYDKGSFVGTDAAWFFDRADHAKTITDWFSLSGSLADVSKGVLANVGNGTAMNVSAQTTSKTATETIKQIEKAAATKAEQAADDAMKAAEAALNKFPKPAKTNPVVANMFKESPEAAAKMRDSLPAAEKEMWAKHFSDVAARTKSEAGRLLNEARAAFLRGQTNTPPGNITDFQ